MKAFSGRIMNAAGPVWSVPNGLSLGRCIAAGSLFFLRAAPSNLLVIFTLASLSDFFDGWLARKLGSVSSLGKLLDPLADKILVGCVYTILFSMGKVDFLLLLLVLGRDLGIILGVLILLREPREISVGPISLSKINTGAQLIYAGALLGNNAGAWHVDTSLLCWSVIALTTWSGAMYLKIFLRKGL